MRTDQHDGAQQRLNRASLRLNDYLLYSSTHFLAGTYQGEWASMQRAQSAFRAGLTEDTANDYATAIEVLMRVAESQYVVGDDLAAHFSAEEGGGREAAFRKLVEMGAPPRSLEEYALDALDGLAGLAKTGDAANACRALIKQYGRMVKKSQRRLWLRASAEGISLNMSPLQADALRDIDLLRDIAPSLRRGRRSKYEATFELLAFAEETTGQSCDSLVTKLLGFVATNLSRAKLHQKPSSTPKADTQGNPRPQLLSDVAVYPSQIFRRETPA